MDERHQCVWLYCVASGGSVVNGQLAGVAAEEIRPVQAAGLTAFAGAVPEDEFGAVALRRNLEDLDWLARCAQAHNDVISAIASSYPVVPMRLATVCQADSGVQEMLTAHRNDLTAALAVVTGRVEWGVKIYARRPQPSSGDPVADAAVQASSGTAYLQHRRTALATVERARQSASDSADQLADALESGAVAAREHAVHDRSLDPDAADMISNWSYLVDDDVVESFVARASELAARFPALRMELTGPWPPYSFAAPPDSELRS